MTIKTGLQPEGNAASQLVQLMRQHGYNKDIEIELGTITGAPPELKLRIDNMPIELEADDLVIAERLTKHVRKVRTATTEAALAAAPVTYIQYEDELSVGDRVIVAATDSGQTYMILDRAVIY